MADHHDQQKQAPAVVTSPGRDASPGERLSIIAQLESRPAPANDPPHGNPPSEHQPPHNDRHEPHEIEAPPINTCKPLGPAADRSLRGRGCASPPAVASPPPRDANTSLAEHKDRNIGRHQ